MRGRGWRRRFRPLAAAVLAATPALAACGGDGGGGPAVDAMVRDSAGIRIVENTGPAWGSEAGWTVSAEPVREIGVLEGDEAQMLDRVRSPRLRSDGILVLADGGTSEIRAFLPDGELAWTSGGFGEGPGEFQAVSSLQILPGDSILVWDVRSRRVSVLSPDGALARSYTAEPPGDAPMAAPTGVLDGDRLLVSGGVSFSSDGEGSTDEAVWPESPHFVGDRTGTLGERIFTVRTTEMRLQRTPGSISIGDLPFARRGFAAASGDRIVTGSSPVAALTWRDLEGTPTQIARWSAQPRPVDDALVERWVQEELAENDEPAVRRYYRDLVEGVEIPDRVPIYTAMRVDARDHVWLKQWREPGATGEAAWWVFSPDGSLQGEVLIPAALEVAEITGDAVVGIVRDEFGVERVRVHRLVR